MPVCDPTVATPRTLEFQLSAPSSVVVAAAVIVSPSCNTLSGASKPVTGSPVIGMAPARSEKKRPQTVKNNAAGNTKLSLKDIFLVIFLFYYFFAFISN
jgi:predicted small secreted protein